METSSGMLHSVESLQVVVLARILLRVLGRMRSLDYIVQITVSQIVVSYRDQMGWLFKMHIPGLHPTLLKVTLLDWMKTLIFFFLKHCKGPLCILKFVNHSWRQEFKYVSYVRKILAEMRRQDGLLASGCNCFGSKTRTAGSIKNKYTKNP